MSTVLLQNETGCQARRIKRSAALTLERRNMAERIGQLIWRLKPERFAKDIPYIPPEIDLTPHAAGHLPPRDGTGCYFKEPQSYAWQLAHRTVNLGQLKRQTA